MAGLDNVPEQTDTTDTSGALPYAKPVAAKGPYALPTGTGMIGVDPALLANLEKMIAEREAQKSSFGERMKDAMAWWSGGVAGPAEPLQNRAIARDKQDADLFQMRAQLSQAQMSQQQAAAMDKMMFGGPSAQPVAGATPGGATPQAVTQNNPGLLGLVKDRDLQDAIKAQYATGDRAGAMKEIRTYLAANAKDTDVVKNVKYMLANNLIDPSLVPTVMLTNVAGASAFVPHDVRGTGGTGQATPFGTASALTKPGAVPAAGTIAGAPAAPAPTAAPAPAPRPAPAAAPAPSAGAPAPAAAPTTGGTMPPAPSEPPAPATFNKPFTSGGPKSPFAPGTKEDLEFKAKVAEVPLAGQTEFAQQTEKQNAARAIEVDKAAQSAPERQTRFGDIIKVTEDPALKQVFGKLAKSGFSPFALKQLESGLNAGQFGTLGIANLERNLMEAGATPDQIMALHRVEKHLAAAELDYAKTYLTGQGAVSDNERKLVKDAVGSVKDPAKVLNMQARIMSERAAFDEKIGRLYGDYRDAKGEYASFGAFMRTPEARQIINEHNKELAGIIGRQASDLSDPFKSGATAPSTGGAASSAAAELERRRKGK